MPRTRLCGPPRDICRLPSVPSDRPTYYLGVQYNCHYKTYDHDQAYLGTWGPRSLNTRYLKVGIYPWRYLSKIFVLVSSGKPSHLQHCQPCFSFYLLLPIPSPSRLSVQCPSLFPPSLLPTQWACAKDATIAANAASSVMKASLNAGNVSNEDWPVPAWAFDIALSMISILILSAGGRTTPQRGHLRVLPGGREAHRNPHAGRPAVPRHARRHLEEIHRVRVRVHRQVGALMTASKPSSLSRRPT